MSGSEFSYVTYLQYSLIHFSFHLLEYLWNVNEVVKNIAIFLVRDKMAFP